MRITLVNKKEHHDYGESVEIDDMDFHLSLDGRFHILEVSQGTFWRYECYSPISPYGWKKLGD